MVLPDAPLEAYKAGPGAEERARQADALELAGRLRRYFGGELPERVNINWDSAGRPIAVFPLEVVTRILDELGAPR